MRRVNGPLLVTVRLVVVNTVRPQSRRERKAFLPYSPGRAELARAHRIASSLSMPLDKAVEICRHRAVVYEQARQQNPRRWSRSTCYWRQPEVVWINPPPKVDEYKPASLTKVA